MKKLFTLFVAALCCMNAFAQDTRIIITECNFTGWDPSIIHIGDTIANDYKLEDSIRHSLVPEKDAVYYLPRTMIRVQQWNPATEKFESMSQGDTITAGTYRLKFQVRIDNEGFWPEDNYAYANQLYGNKYRFPDAIADIEVIVNDEEWTIDDKGLGSGDNYSFLFVSSPAFTITYTKSICLNGKFSVAADKQVVFSQGNLQFHCTGKSWQFAENQYDIIGSANANIAEGYNGWIDLFGWGTSGYNNVNPWLNTSNDLDYGNPDNNHKSNIAGTEYDWGVHNAISNGGNQAGLWRTLTAAEWKYLAAERENAASLRSFATVAGIEGLIFLPDNWDLTAMPLTATLDNYTTVNITAVDWVSWQTAGAVFLPKAGTRYPNTGTYSSNNGLYATSTYDSSFDTYRVYKTFDFTYFVSYDGIGGADFMVGAAVRLVQDYVAPKPDMLNGKFSVADGKQIQFSKGNLQYHCKNQTWRFAPKQTDVIGADNANIAADYDGFIDLFGWGTGNNPTQASTNSNGSEYSTYTDWGTNIGEPNEWRTLSNDEWRYLFYGRNDAATLFAFATVNNVPGVVLLPDDWETPTGLTFTASTTQGLEDKGSYYGSSVACYSHNTYTAEQWQIMETAGAVFLPATGYRNGTTVEEFNSMDKNGNYWSSTSYNSTRANSLYFTRIALYPSSSSGTRRIYGCSVRLVQDVTGAPEAIDNTPFPSGEGRGEAHKRIVNGQLIIEKNGRTYNAIGAEVK